MSFRKKIWSWVFAIVSAAIVAWTLLGCLWPGIDVIDPPPPPDPEPLGMDTVCTTYTDVTLPAFISGYMIADGASTTGPRVIVVWSHSDTLAAGDDVAASLKTLLEEVYPQYEHHVWVRPGDDRYFFFITKGTSDKTKLYGKTYIRYAGARYQTAVQTQKLMAMTMTDAEFKSTISEYPSFRFIDWYGTAYDSIQYIEHADLAIDTAHCKGGRDWMDFRHNPYQMLQRVYDDAHDAGWGFVGENLTDSPYVWTCAYYDGEWVYAPGGMEFQEPR